LSSRLRGSNLCFISHHIPDTYVKKLQQGIINRDEDGKLERDDDQDDGREVESEGDEEKQGEEEEEFITVRATNWLDLGT